MEIPKALKCLTLLLSLLPCLRCVEALLGSQPSQNHLQSAGSGLCGIGPLGYYNGSLAVTESGSECLNWAEFPDYVQQYPDRGLGNHNYCRNPDGGATPWCFYRLASGVIGWASCDCNQGAVRLSEGGRVELYFSGLWGTICADHWTDWDASVVCRQLGVSEIGTARKNFLAAWGPVPLRLQSANCHGDEKALLQCGYQEAASGACNQGIAAAECVPPAEQVLVPRCGWLGERRASRGEWRSTTTASGAPSVMTNGTTGMPRWFAGNWGSVGLQRPSRGLTMGRDPAQSCWMKWSAQGTSCHWTSARRITGDSKTVITLRMQECPVTPSQRAQSGWQEAAPPAKGGWRFITGETGARCVMTAGRLSMPRWSAGSWASVALPAWHLRGSTHLAKALSFWTTWLVQAQSSLSWTVHTATGGSMTARMPRMWGSDAPLKPTRSLKALLLSVQVPSLTRCVSLCYDHWAYSRAGPPVRLADGESTKEGRVEVFLNGQWGSVCDDGWTDRDAAVVCRQLGYSGAAKARTMAYFGEGHGPIHLDNVECSGTERTLGECATPHSGIHNCWHSEDAGVICDYMEEKAQDTRHAGSASGTCGRRLLYRRKKRIIGGDKSLRGGWPWQASLRLQGFHRDTRLLCGATLIHSCWVLTAAHCFKRFGTDVRRYRLRVGDYHTGVREAFEREMPIERIVLHRNYRSSSNDNDIALVRMRGRGSHCLSFNHHVLPICLPDRKEKAAINSQACIISGWGDTDPNTPSD
ncbi:neurotrypsin-like isoform X4 [Lepidochelys kempii]|uniref:neurotrypsin-like isoform X4 n=1 Tax=Lepidochelys kempii TaxID=8472 RepID=UPI003C6EEA7F